MYVLEYTCIGIAIPVRHIDMCTYTCTRVGTCNTFSVDTVPAKRSTLEYTCVRTRDLIVPGTGIVVGIAIPVVGMVQVIAISAISTTAVKIAKR